jgi:hypothetical protein
MHLCIDPVMSKIKIVYILPWLSTDGSESHVANQCSYLDSQRFETMVVYRRGDWGPIGEELGSSGVRMVHNP